MKELEIFACKCVVSVFSLISDNIKSNRWITFLNFFLFILSQLVFFQRKVLFFVGLFIIVHDLTQLLQLIEIIYYLFIDTLFLLCCILSNQENLYMIHLV